MSGSHRAGQELREALEALADGVPPAAPTESYRSALGAWRRRERKRRVVLAILILVVFVLAILAGLWVLNGASSGEGVIYSAALDDRYP